MMLALICLSACVYGQQTQSEKINGNWQGSLKTPSGNLDLVLKIKSLNDRLFTKLDVPAQGAKDIPATKSMMRNDSLIVEFAMMRASYKGIYKSDSSLISGVWEQGGVKFPLKLIKTDKTVFTVKHPQEPQRPYEYNEDSVVFENKVAHVKLAGTFTWPKNKKNCPAVILISGSGAQNRDEELLGQKPFLVLADYLTKNGIAVLRYDDRGTNESTGDYKSATTFDFADDAEAAVRYLKTRKEIDKKKIGLAGHSEGGLIAPILASRSKDVAFIILLAGPGLKGADLIALQSAAIAKKSGMSDEDVAETTMINKQVYALAIANKTGAADSIKQLLKEVGMPEQSANTQVKTILSPWYRTFLATDPAEYLAKVNCPVLALNGKKDVQVVCTENTEAIEKSLSANKTHTIKTYDDLNHLFQHCKTGMVDEYAQIEETMSPEVLKDISDWVLQLK